MPISEDIKPSFFSFNNTERCQSRCITCPGWQTPAEVAKDELTTQEWKDILKNIHDWVGDFRYIFSGGEPFLREDIFEIAEYAKSIGIIVDVVTNGLALTNRAEELVNSAFECITFSLNAVKNPLLHIESRGRKDSFKKTMDVIQNVNYLNKKYNKGKWISLSMLVMPTNLDEIKPVAEFAKLEGIGVCYQLLDNGDAFCPPKNQDEHNEKFNEDISEKSIAAIQEMIDLKKAGYPIYNGYPQLDSFKQLMYDLKEKSQKQPATLPPEVIECKDSDIEVDSETEKQNIEEQSTEENSNDSQQVQHISDMECQVGFHNFAINPYGEVRLCFCMDKIGSLKEDTPENIWKSEKADKIRSAIAKCPKSCKLLNCNFKE